MGQRYGRYLAVAGLIALLGLALYAELNQHGQLAGVSAGAPMPPFAAPLALGGPSGNVDVATHTNEGPAGKRPACSVRGPGILNICQLYEQGPVVLALFIDAGSCPSTLDGLQRLSGSFPQVRFAAVAIKGEAAPVAHLVRSHHLRFPVALDADGRLAGLYRMVGCSQLTFAYPGGVVQGAPLVEGQPLGVLRARISQLLAASRARGWRPRAAAARAGGGTVRGRGPAARAGGLATAVRS